MRTPWRKGVCCSNALFDMSAKFEKDFLQAASSNNFLKLKNLLQHGASVDCVNDKGQTALHICCSKGHINLVRYLCSSRANLEIQDEERVYPIHNACSFGQADVLKELISNGAIVDVFAKGLETPLHIASMKGHAVAVDVLLTNGARVDFPNALGHTALHLAARHGHLECVIRLLKTANIFVQTQYGDTALHWACQEGHLLVAKEILAMVGDQLAKENALKLTNKNGRSPRDVAETWRQLEVLSWIDCVLTGCDVEILIVYARENCEAIADNYLSFSEGDLIAVISKPYSDWWIGRRKNEMEQGLFSTVMIDQRPIDPAAFLEPEAKVTMLEKFRASNRQLGDVLGKIRQRMSKDAWFTLCNSTSILNLHRKQDILMEHLNKHDQHLIHPLLCYMLQSRDQYRLPEPSQAVSPLSSQWEKMSAGSGRLRAFVRRLTTKLAISLIATKVVASSSSSKDEAFCCSFCCLLESLYETPGITLLASQPFMNVSHQKKYQVLDQIIPNSLEELEQVVLNTTEYIKYAYEKQIRYLSHRGAETLADCMVLQIMESINLDGLNNEPCRQLHRQLARCLVFGRRSTSMAALLRATTPELADTEYMKQSGMIAHWTVHGILRMTGIQTRDGKHYCGLQSQPGQYGYRNGSRNEAVELCMAVAGEQKLIGPYHKLLTYSD